MDQEFYRQQAQRVRDLAARADPFTTKRLLDLADSYDTKGGGPSRASRAIDRPPAASPRGAGLRPVQRGMKKRQPLDTIEVRREACERKGHPPAHEPSPDRRIYPASCKKCGGNGHLAPAS